MSCPYDRQPRQTHIATGSGLLNRPKPTPNNHIFSWTMETHQFDWTLGGQRFVFFMQRKIDSLDKRASKYIIHYLSGSCEVKGWGRRENWARSEEYNLIHDPIYLREKMLVYWKYIYIKRSRKLGKMGTEIGNLISSPIPFISRKKIFSATSPFSV